MIAIKRWFRAVLVTSFLSFNAAYVSDAHAREISLLWKFEPSSEALTTESAWAIDPNEPNPHRQRWLLKRDVQLMDLQASQSTEKPSSSKKKIAGTPEFIVDASQLRATTALHVRAPGTWFQNVSDFRCEQEPNDWFQTRDGAMVAGKAAAQLWEAALASARLRLQLQLKKVREDSADKALKRGMQIFRQWLRDVDSEWSVRGHARARVIEWRTYLEAVAPLKVCETTKQKAERKALPVPSWKQLMDQPASAEYTGKILARAPAKRWGGLYSIRVSMDIGGHRLNGKFLVDSGAAQSIISPLWLTGQGVNPVLVEIPGVPAQRVTWSGGSGVARKTWVLETTVSGHTIPINEFLMMETELFQPPQYISTCCDGILGADFLRLYAAEFTAGSPSEVKLWPRQGFRWPSQGSNLEPWIEVSTAVTGETISDCKLTSGSIRLEGARWDTGSDVALDIHVPWQSHVKHAVGKDADWTLSCDDLQIASKVPQEFPNSEDEDPSSPFRAKYPAANIGTPVMGRGDFVLDLSHGRLWFSKLGLDKSIPHNRTGLDVDYVINKEGDRELRVTRIRQGTVSEALKTAGLKSGMEITEVDSKSTDDLDIWDVEQRLSGVYSDTVTLQWKTKDGLKLFPLSVTKSP